MFRLAVVRVCAVLSLVPMVGCAWDAELPEVPTSHPANPEAEAAPLHPPSTVLSVDRPVQPAEPMPMMHHDTHKEDMP